MHSRQVNKRERYYRVYNCAIFLSPIFHSVADIISEKKLFDWYANKYKSSREEN